jgi:hypothetical protein
MFWFDLPEDMDEVLDLNDKKKQCAIKKKKKGRWKACSDWSRLLRNPCILPTKPLLFRLLGLSFVHCGQRSEFLP